MTQVETSHLFYLLDALLAAPDKAPILLYFAEERRDQSPDFTSAVHALRCSTDLAAMCAEIRKSIT